MNLVIQPGDCFPLGAMVRDGGVNFCVYARGATAVDLLLFESPESPKPETTIRLSPDINQTFHYWHVFIAGVSAGQVYGYRVTGPCNPSQGTRFNPNKVLLDPYARSVVGWQNYSRQAATDDSDNCAQALRAVVVDPLKYEWEGDLHPRTPYAETIIYELHVGGFTQHASSGLPVEKRGTYAGLIEKIPYLKSLGITAVELMPVQEFDATDAPAGLTNYWGYSPVAFFAPHRGYSSRQDKLGPVNEFRDMVKAFHRAGIEVILDVVFNHTAEGNHQGPTLSLKGFGNEDYYILDQACKGYYKDYSGCGNTLKTSAISGYLILDCLRYWVTEMHIDGFRFDLASVLSRGVTGEPLVNPPLLWMINTDPALASTKIIAEAWDAAGLYQVGHFAGERFAEWNGPYRDDIRRFVKGDSGVIRALADRIVGSPDLYALNRKSPNYSVHFVTCHDGFTLYDMVSYNYKHNLANGEENRDGANDNWSWDCGIEGPTDDLAVQKLRLKQAKNLLVLWAMSQGTPMLLMGDETLRSQLGNNNAYCQNNPISWFNWDNVTTQADFLHFVQGLIEFIQNLQVFRHDHHLVATSQAITEPAITWHGTRLGLPDWSYDSHSLAFTLRYGKFNESLHVMLNAFYQPLVFELPSLGGKGHWRRVVDTALESPDDFCCVEKATKVDSSVYKVDERSSVVLIACK
ncbi:glycogen debranching enzyme [Leptolyngbya sp. Heron Island J]|uniref:glycogen debranching protein GlgX n=1 Tax=Leptolyngbya sp. Heron Island J TaxID=1385935 RepID=UPI0003B9B4F9|nr:glycogen debranching protein GlgX [Leptolyngbya sp. Heron Island J]ESA33601.1 glycogen debranching enzyme [Leptolyngbya sp. Heron Island J]